MSLLKTILAGAFFAGLLNAAPIPQDDPPVVMFSSGNYIITLKSGTPLEARDAHVNWATGLHRRGLSRRQETNITDTENLKTYDLYSYHGYAGYFDAASISEISAQENVESVEPDLPVYLNEVIEARPDTPVRPKEIINDRNATWGLARISNLKLGGRSYNYDDSAGDGTFAYVVDSGVNAEHRDFGGRVTLGENFVGGANTDNAGHGTHVAATIGGRTFGVAKNTNIVSVKVFGAGAETSLSTIMSGYEWAVNDITSNGREGVSVINMSLGTEQGVSTALNSMLEEAFQNGVLTVVAAGNGINGIAIDAGETSPGSAPNALTVGATDENDERAEFSNFGSVVDVHAPGVDVTSAWIGSSSATETISGTSMAAPHVAGLVVYLKGLESGLDSPAAATARVLELAQDGVLSSVPRGTDNLLIYNGNGE